MKRTELDEKYVKLVASKNKVLKDTRYNITSKEAVCLKENEHFIVEEKE